MFNAKLGHKVKNACTEIYFLSFHERADDSYQYEDEILDNTMNQDSPGGTGADEEIASYQSGKGLDH